MTAGMVTESAPLVSSAAPRDAQCPIVAFSTATDAALQPSSAAPLSAPLHDFTRADVMASETIASMSWCGEGTKVRVLADLEIFLDPASGVQRGTASVGEVLVAAGPPVLVDDFAMLPLLPGGAVQADWVGPLLVEGVPCAGGLAGEQPIAMAVQTRRVIRTGEDSSLLSAVPDLGVGSHLSAVDGLVGAAAEEPPIVMDFEAKSADYASLPCFAADEPPSAMDFDRTVTLTGATTDRLQAGAAAAKVALAAAQRGETSAERIIESAPLPSSAAPDDAQFASVACSAATDGVLLPSGAAPQNPTVTLTGEIKAHLQAEAGAVRGALGATKDRLQAGADAAKVALVAAQRGATSADGVFESAPLLSSAGPDDAQFASVARSAATDGALLPSGAAPQNPTVTLTGETKARLQAEAGAVRVALVAAEAKLEEMVVALEIARRRDSNAIEAMKAAAAEAALTQVFVAGAEADVAALRARLNEVVRPLVAAGRAEAGRRKAVLLAANVRDSLGVPFASATLVVGVDADPDVCADAGSACRAAGLAAEMKQQIARRRSEALERKAKLARLGNA